MKILYVPHWLSASVRTKLTSKKQLTSVKELLNIVSKEDLGFYIYLNTRLTKLLPEPIVQTFDSWGSSFLDQILALDGDLMNDLMRQWDNYDVQGHARPVEGDDYILTCDLSDEHTIVFRHVPPTEQARIAVGHTPLLWLLDRVIRQYHPFLPFESLVETPLYLAYLEALADHLPKVPVPEEDSTEKNADNS